MRLPDGNAFIRFSLVQIDDYAFIKSIYSHQKFIDNVRDCGLSNDTLTKQYIKNTIIPNYKKGIGMLIVKDAITDENIGICGLLKRDTLDYYDIGYAIHPKYKGQGYMTNAVGLVVDFYSKGLACDGLLAIVIPSNIASIKILMKNKFVYQKTIEGESKETHLYQRNIKTTFSNNY